MKTLISVLFWMTLTAAPAKAQNVAVRNLAQKLGYGPEAKLLIGHLEDLGSVRSANLAARHALDHGVAMSGSVMTPGPSVASVPELLGDLAGLDLGIHVTMTIEDSRVWKPAADPKLIPSLVDAKGNLARNPFGLFLWGNPKQIAIETEAQIQTAMAMGIRPTHLDTHMGTAFFKPSWLESYLNLARKYRLAPMVPRWSEGIANFLGPLSGVAQFYVKPLLDQIEAAGFLLLDDFYIFPFPAKDEGYEVRKQKYINMIRNLKPGVTEVVLHPAYADDEFMRQILVEGSGLWVRDHEARLLVDPEIARILAEEGVRLIGWREIQRAYDWDRVSEVSFR